MRGVLGVVRRCWSWQRVPAVCTGVGGYGNKLVGVTSQNLANLRAVEDRGDPPFGVEGPPARMMRSFDHVQGH